MFTLKDIISDENKRSTFMAMANSLKFSRGIEPNWNSATAAGSGSGGSAEQAVANVTFDCALHFETQLPSGRIANLT